MNLIWNEWFRDQNLQDSLTVPKGNGPDSYTLYQMNYRNKRHDYFCSALPWTQKGPAVSMPIVNQSGYLPVVTNGTAPKFVFGDDVIQRNLGANTAGYVNYSGAALGSNKHPAVFGSESGLRASLNDDTLGTAITALRQAMMMQTLLERDARGGTRYVEMLRHRFGVISPDFRLQRPELLSTSSITLQQTCLIQLLLLLMLFVRRSSSRSFMNATPVAVLAILRLFVVILVLFLQTLVSSVQSTSVALLLVLL